MSTAFVIRTASFPAPRWTPADHLDAGVGSPVLCRCRSTNLGARSALRLKASMSTPPNSPSLHRRARSDADLAESPRPSRTESRRSPPTKVAEEEQEEEEIPDLGGFGMWREAPKPVVVTSEEEVEYSGGGVGKGRKIGGGGDQGGDPNRRIGDYYQKMLRSDPSNPLLLRNYGRFLHEVEGDVKGAEEYYGRAILASPADGDLLSLYGKLVWETHGDGERAGDYFRRAVEAAPDDCYVLGSYAHFLWDAEEEEEEAEENGRVASSSPLVGAF